MILLTLETGIDAIVNIEEDFGIADINLIVKQNKLAMIIDIELRRLLLQMFDYDEMLRISAKQALIEFG